MDPKQDHPTGGHFVETYRGQDIFFHVSSYNCPSLRLWGFVYDTQIKARIRKALKEASEVSK
jgi:hypothetical protein